MNGLIKTTLRYSLFMLLILFGKLAHADFYIVVNANNPQQNMTKKEVVNLFMGRSRGFSNGDFALVFDLPRDDPNSAAFYKALTGWSMAQVNSYWSRLMFSGQSMPPQPLPNEKAMIDILKRNPSGIGWLSEAPEDDSLRAILVLKELP
ncbi:MULTISPECIES: hypothetical protein [Aliiglaciecola]|uniref:hypothetical protein n=1 Tax=Aliiglaciecola TaxID=1406885 RepID=UPI001C0A5C18|nr:MULTISPECIES: hypothetical protein [Aliiglaciecola]MBU2877408.1 hypothetical protein [Aliiglaciecola lipolytica]MDO6712830.1 hypothetical protein [Aliiglaciecola sp. 2_MG-2023]MDO6753925.1 hypothetical protein [Aliiglaciecola sp. 1_MG-2023]